MKPTAAFLCFFFAIATMPVIAYAGGKSPAGGGAGKVATQDLHVTKQVDKSSPNLYRSVTTGGAPKGPTMGKSSR
jgi:type VI protein secretion system component Hcp